jgi:hypothetical protein
MIHIIEVGSEMCVITQDMMSIYEDMAQNVMKLIDHLDLALAKVPTKSLYKLQLSVT